MKQTDKHIPAMYEDRSREQSEITSHSVKLRTRIPGKRIPLLLTGFLVFTSLTGCSVHVRGNVDTAGDPLRVSVTTQNGDEVTQTTRVFGMTEENGFLL